MLVEPLQRLLWRLWCRAHTGVRSWVTQPLYTPLWWLHCGRKPSPHQHDGEALRISNATVKGSCSSYQERRLIP